MNLNSTRFYFSPCSLYVRSRFLFFCNSTLVRLRRGRSRRHSSSSSSSRSLQLQPHHQCFECRRHGLLVVLLVLCDTCSVAAILFSSCDSWSCWNVPAMIAVVTVDLSNSGVRCKPSSYSSAAVLQLCHHQREATFHLVLVSPGTLLLRAASCGPGSPRSIFHICTA